MAVQRLHSARSVCAGHFNEAEAAGTTGVAIIDQRHRLYRTMLFEERALRPRPSRTGDCQHTFSSCEEYLLQKKLSAGQMPATWIEETCFVGCGQGDAGAAR